MLEILLVLKVGSRLQPALTWFPTEFDTSDMPGMWVPVVCGPCGGFLKSVLLVEHGSHMCVCCDDLLFTVLARLTKKSTFITLSWK